MLLYFYLKRKERKYKQNISISNTYFFIIKRVHLKYFFYLYCFLKYALKIFMDPNLVIRQIKINWSNRNLFNSKIILMQIFPFAFYIPRYIYASPYFCKFQTITSACIIHPGVLITECTRVRHSVGQTDGCFHRRTLYSGIIMTALFALLVRRNLQESAASFIETERVVELCEKKKCAFAVVTLT